MRIYSNRFYIRETVPGISGFKRWDQRERTIVTGLKARSCVRSEIVAEYTPPPNGRFELHDGHLPGYRPIVDGWAQAAHFLASAPFQCVSECVSECATA